MARFFKGLFSILLVSTFFLAAWQHQAIADWWFLRNYEPSEAVAQLADEAHMSEHGRRAFYVADPVINDKQEFNANCPIVEESLILGCYNGGQIFVLEVERPELEGVMEVTAAHEMLHSAYDRMDMGEREEVDQMLEEAYADIDNQRLRDLIGSYEDRGGAEIRRNELHSILPTQIEDLPQQLEDHYDQYFSNRQAVVDMYQEYESTFIELNRRIDDRRSELSNIRDQLSSLEVAIDQQLNRVESLNRRLEQLEEEGETEEYNELVPEQNQAVDRYNSLVNQYRGLLSRHNSLVDEINRLVLLQNDLVNSLDSSYESL